MEITMLKNKKVVLVTGGAGFIGSNVCSALLNRNCHVICMDNLFCSTLKNIQCFSHNPDFEFIEHDITQPFSFYVDIQFCLSGITETLPKRSYLYNEDKSHRDTECT